MLSSPWEEGKAEKAEIMRRGGAGLVLHLPCIRVSERPTPPVDAGRRQTLAGRAAPMPPPRAGHGFPWLSKASHATRSYLIFPHVPGKLPEPFLKKKSGQSKISSDNVKMFTRRKEQGTQSKN